MVRSNFPTSRNSDLIWTLETLFAATLGPELLCSYDTTVDRASLLLNHAREQKEKGQEVIIVHVRVGGDGGQARDANNYVSLPDSSPTSTADLCKTRVMITQLAGVLQSGEIGLSLSPSSLDPRPDEVVRSRPMISPFHDTDLARLLRDSKVKEVIIAGVATSGVVLGSAQSSIDHGLGVTVVKDACMDPDQDLHDVLMK